MPFARTRARGARTLPREETYRSAPQRAMEADRTETARQEREELEAGVPSWIQPPSHENSQHAAQ